MNAFVPPHVEPNVVPLGMLASWREVRKNVLSILPGIAYTQPIVTGVTGPARWHMVQGPEGMRHVFLDKVDNYPKSEVMIRMLRPAVGSSLFTSEGADWRWQRRAIAPVFAARNVTALAPMMTATAERASERLAKTGSSEMVREMLSATFDVICEVALSGREHFDAEVYGEAITRYFVTVGRASLLDFLEVPPWVPRPGEVLGRKAVKTMHRMVSAAIEARRQAGVAPSGEDLLDYMLAAEDPKTGRRMSPTDLLHNMQFFIVAGHETTALALSWALYLLSESPEIQTRAREQARDVLGPRAAGADDLDQMPLIRAILDETMRLYPPVGLLARNVVEPDQIYDREIRPRETVFLNVYGLHRHTLYWDDPGRFDPDRFAPGVSRDRYLHLPFGAGPRVCVGANFAMMQAEIILATLLARFDFAPAGPRPTPIMHMTIRPDPGVTLKVTPLDRETRP
jgi:cytochrome P450